jgi:hypothetical protein
VVKASKAEFVVIDKLEVVHEWCQEVEKRIVVQQ